VTKEQNFWEKDLHFFLQEHMFKIGDLGCSVEEDLHESRLPGVVLMKEEIS
jgi:hypothetical protein